MSSIRHLRSLRSLHSLPHAQYLPSPRLLTTTPHPSKLMGSNPSANLPDPDPDSSAAPNAKVRTDTQNTDPQSSASKVEHLEGDDHPAKQPDYQAKPTRSTGIGGQEEVKGGKEGLADRGLQKGN